MGSIKDTDTISNLLPKDQLMLNQDGCVKNIKYEDLEFQIVDENVKIEDSLESTDPKRILSARQGNILDGMLTDVKAGGLDDESIGLNKLNEQVKNFVGSAGNNNPDYEDLTSVSESGINVIKLKDRTYNPNNFSGLGNSILRKNINEGVNILTSSMIKPNTIHEIRYDYDLNGETINIPDNVTLKFIGGTLSNGIIIGNKTVIDAPLNKIFYSNLSFDGYFINDNVYSEWFGAKSEMLNPIENDAITPIASKPPSKVNELIDSSEAINKALDFSLLSKGKVSLQAGCYRINNTVFIKDKMHLELCDKTVIFAFMNGDGNIIVTQDPETSLLGSPQIINKPILTLQPNQYIHTDATKQAINISSVAARISGRGTLSLIMSKYTIGIYMKGTGYRILDMATNNNIDLITVGGTQDYNWIPDSRDLSGDGIPSNNIGNPLDYYNDFTNKRYYQKNGNNIWVDIGSSYCEYNISYRFEVYEGWNSGRIINPQVYLGDMLGWRGVEIITRDGGWFNQSVFKGSIANKTGSYISIFTDYDVSEHDWNGVIIQIDARQGNDQRIFQAIRCGGFRLGITWDLNYVSPPRSNVAYYLGKFSRLNSVMIDGFKYMVDKGVDNKYDIYPNQVNVDSVVSKQYKNVLEYFSPAKASRTAGQNLFYVPLNSLMTIDEITAYVATQPSGTGYTIPKEWFDCDRDSSTVAIDTDNGKFGCAFQITVRQDDYASFHGINNRGFIVVEYSLTGVSGVTRDAGFKLYALDTDRTPYTRGVNRVYPLSQNAPDLNRNYLYIPITGKDDSGGGTLYVYPESVQSGKTLVIHSVKFLVDSDIRVPEWIYNPRHGSLFTRPDAAPKGFIYYNTTSNTAEINTGTSSSPIWQEFLKESSGDWVIPNNGAITYSKASYSTIGKQIALAGTLTFNEANVNSGITLPFTPEYGGVITINELTFIIYTNSTSAYVRSSTAGSDKTFWLNFKTQ
ncbi:hypothetical protein M2T28_14230 [Elizabethkingia miricola]|uniref:hypothetical protein n=1 Tax=Elizabethkingia miricola TaxID=172045 RepID=UPI00201910BE|nr:hypothetical protein [Elizabethkingia miricola]MCL1653778.1 hypothetical protein [Elizabethkingia miricola]DAN07598.1 MAG TPA: hypothetical protein [Crassvirales sp.]